MVGMEWLSIVLTSSMLSLKLSTFQHTTEWTKECTVRNKTIDFPVPYMGIVSCLVTKINKGVVSIYMTLQKGIPYIQEWPCKVPKVAIITSN